MREDHEHGPLDHAHNDAAMHTWHGEVPIAADHDGRDIGHDHDHRGHDHPHDDDRAHGHEHGHEASGLLGHLPFFHNHSHGETNVDSALEGSEEGLRTLAISLVLLGVTAGAQLAIAVLSSSVGLLADTIHNAGDALTALPLGLAFMVSRRPPNRRYTYV